jgi:hypothetical protein
VEPASDVPNEEIKSKVPNTVKKGQKPVCPDHSLSDSNVTPRTENSSSSDDRAPDNILDK